MTHSCVTVRHDKNANVKKNRFDNSYKKPWQQTDLQNVGLFFNKLHKKTYKQSRDEGYQICLRILLSFFLSFFFLSFSLWTWPPQAAPSKALLFLACLSPSLSFAKSRFFKTRTPAKKSDLQKKTVSLTPVAWLYFEAKLEKSNDFSRRKREGGREKQRRHLRPQATEYKGSVCVRERGWERERQRERERGKKTTNAVRERDHQQLEMKCTTSAKTSWSHGVLVWLAEEPYKCSERVKASDSERDHLQM